MASNPTFEGENSYEVIRDGNDKDKSHEYAELPARGRTGGHTAYSKSFIICLMLINLVVLAIGFGIGFGVAYPKPKTDQDQGCAKYAVINHSFETEDEGWQEHMDGFSYSADTASHRVQSAKVQNGGPRQVFKFNLCVRSFQVKADSYNEDVVGGNPNDYSIYCDVKFLDGAWSYGHAEPFTVGYGAWETKTLVVNTSQDIDEGWCYGMFRNHTVGVAYFDNFHVWTSGTDIKDCEAS